MTAVEIKKTTVNVGVDAMRRHHAIEVQPGVQGGAPCIGGTRIPTEILCDFVVAGDRPGHLAESYDIERGQVLLACWYEFWHGPFGRSRSRTARALREPWKRWVDENFKHMWRSEWDKVADPPNILEVPA